MLLTRHRARLDPGRDPAEEADRQLLDVDVGAEESGAVEDRPDELGPDAAVLTGGPVGRGPGGGDDLAPLDPAGEDPEAVLAGQPADEAAAERPLSSPR